MKQRLFAVFLIVLLVAPISSVIEISNAGEESNGFLSEQISINNNIVDMINQVNESLVKNYLKGLTEIGPRYTGSENCKKAANYIFDEFKKIGLDVKIEPWRYLQYNCQNVVATLNGSDPDSDAVIIISAHYDTVKNTPGANDDGTGVSAILSIANIFSKYLFKHTIKFIAFSGEEIGALGAHAYVKKAYENNENIIAVLDIDMIGYTNSSSNKNFLQILFHDRSKWIFDLSNQIIETYSFSNFSVKISPNFPSCNYHPFFDYGYDGVLFTHDNSIFYPWLHKPEDTIDKINYSYFTNATKILVAILGYIANIDIAIQVRIVSPLESHFYISNIPIKLPGFNFYKTGLRGMTYVIGRPYVKINISSEEEIDYVWFCIDGMAEGFSKGYTDSWRLKRGFYPLRGKHKISVYVFTKSGKVAYDEMDVFVLSIR